jgi:hypothetical protein
VCLLGPEASQEVEGQDLQAQQKYVPTKGSVGLIKRVRLYSCQSPAQDIILSTVEKMTGRLSC